jgi:hypothetical protein
MLKIMFDKFKFFFFKKKISQNLEHFKIKNIKSIFLAVF